MSVIRDILNSTKLLLNNSLPTTGSNTFVGTQTFSGSIIPATNNTYDLGSITKQFRDLYLSCRYFNFYNRCRAKYQDIGNWW